MKLHYKQFSSEGAPLVILHGLYGNGGNWAAHARQLSSEFAVYTFDARNHGQSPRASSMLLTEMAADVVETMQALELESAHLLGHSLGGKTAMLVALQAPSVVQDLIVVDIAPIAYNKQDDEILAALCALKLENLQSRAEADAKLAEDIASKGVRDFLLTNLQRDEAGKFSWRINLPVIAENFTQLTGWPERDKVYEGRTLFIKGSESRYILPEYEQQTVAQFPNASLKVVTGAGHWVHSEKPEAVQKLIRNFLLAATN
ncbi:MAG: alpha/beta fold hydrolase [Pseudomonadota bacterium]